MRRAFLYAAWVLALAGCVRAATVADRVTVRDVDRYGGDEVVGVLHVSEAEAYLTDEAIRIILIDAPPQTAMSPATLARRTAELLRPLAGKRVRARGDLQGRFLWGAEVQPVGGTPDEDANRTRTEDRG